MEQPHTFLNLSETKVSLHQTEHERWVDIGKMSALMVHEMKTALSSAVLLTELLAQSMGVETLYQKKIEQIEHSHQQLAHQLEMLSLFIHGHQHYLKPERVMLESWCQVLQERVAISIGEKQVKFNFNNQLAIKEVSIHSESLLSAILNLVINALQAKARCIRMDINQHENHCWQIAITDNGAGMSDEVYAKALLPFFTTKPQGNGLGLVVVNAVVQAHGGSMRLDSSVGVGSRFIITLPVEKMLK